MAKKGLNKETIIEAALALIEEKGMPGFSLRTLALSLDVQVSSLYNHISGQNELLTEVGLRAVEKLVEAEEYAIAGKTKDAAVFALADAYRAFAAAHPELYRIIMGIHMLELPVLEAAGEKIIAPILSVLEGYGLDQEHRMHYQRVLRSVMHGFYDHERTGGFSLTSVDRETSYRMAIECVVTALNREGEANEKR